MAIDQGDILNAIRYAGRECDMSTDSKFWKCKHTASTSNEKGTWPDQSTIQAEGDNW